MKTSDGTVTGCDLYNGIITGDTACALNANSGASANHAGPTLLIGGAEISGGGVLSLSQDSRTREEDGGTNAESRKR